MKEVKYFTTDGKEVQFGNTMHLHKEKQTRYGSLVRDELIEVTQDSIPHLIKRGAIVVKEVNKEDEITKLIEKLANHLNCNHGEAIDFLDAVYTVNTTAFYNMVFKKLAIEFDKAYPDHISKAEKLFFIGTMDFKVHIVANRKNINFKNFAAFRTHEDAKKAIEIANTIASYLGNEE